MLYRCQHGVCWSVFAYGLFVGGAFFVHYYVLVGRFLRIFFRVVGCFLAVAFVAGDYVRRASVCSAYGYVVSFASFRNCPAQFFVFLVYGGHTALATGEVQFVCIVPRVGLTPVLRRFRSCAWVVSRSTTWCRATCLW